MEGVVDPGNGTGGGEAAGAAAAAEAGGGAAVVAAAAGMMGAVAVAGGGGGDGKTKMPWVAAMVPPSNMKVREPSPFVPGMGRQ